MSSANFVRASIEKSIQDLPALSPVVNRILKETEGPDACPQSVERLISSEQALASKVLRVVNSAYYGLSGQVTSLGQAIVILGLQQIRNLVLSVSAFSTIRPKTARDLEIMEAFWLHSFASATAMQIIAKRKNFALQDSETAFVAALLHDIGRLFLFSNFRQSYDQAIRYAETKGVLIEEAERKLLGLDHGEVGGQMAEVWKLPKVLVRLIGDHEAPNPDVVDPLLYALHVADWVTKEQYFDIDRQLEPLPAFVEEWLGYTPEEIYMLRDQTRDTVDEARSLFGLIAA